jgi:hypothetical protein
VLVLVLEARLMQVRVRVDEIAMPVLVLVLDVLMIVGGMRMRVHDLPVAVLVAVGMVVPVLVHARSSVRSRGTLSPLAGRVRARLS